MATAWRQKAYWAFSSVNQRHSWLFTAPLVRMSISTWAFEMQLRNNALVPCHLANSM